jgi:large subunit ribosomal protein L25
MSEVYVIEAKAREEGGKGIARRIRNEGYVPAVIYGSKQEPQKVAVTGHSLKMAIQQGGFLTQAQEIKVDGKSEKVLPREVQLDPVSDKIMHVDFLRYDAKRIVKAVVGIEMVDLDKCPGAKVGGVPSLARTEVELLCRADSIPQVLYVSMEGLDVGEAVKFSSIELPEGVNPAIADRDFTLASILATRTSVMSDEEEDAAAAAAAGAEGTEGAEGEESEDKASKE